MLYTAVYCCILLYDSTQQVHCPCPGNVSPRISYIAHVYVTQQVHCPCPGNVSPRNPFIVHVVAMSVLVIRTFSMYQRCQSNIYYYDFYLLQSCSRSNFVILLFVFLSYS